MTSMPCLRMNSGAPWKLMLSPTTTVGMPNWTAAPLQSSTRAAHEALPGSELVLLNGENHNAMDTHPDAFVAQVEDWLLR